MRKSPRLLILGLDGAAYGLMTGWMAAGHLPTFAAFAQDAAVSPLRCTWPPHTATGWTSLFTGRLPGEHGIFQFWDCQDPNYNLRVTPQQAAGCPILWDVFAEKGWTVGLINIPMSHPPGSWPGYQITWPLVPTLHYSKPSGLLRELSSIGGLALPDIACMYDASPDYPERAKKYIQARTRTVKHLITNRPTDVVAVVYTEIDRVCHHYWHGLDLSHPEHEQASLEEKEVIADIYAEIDRAFAEILDLVDDDCLVMVVSDHGFGPGIRGLRLHQILNQEGFCFFKNDSAFEMPKHKARNDTDSTANYLTAFDWERTTIYMPTPGCYGVNLNLKGRQVSGIVAASEKKAILNAVSEYLLELSDPSTNNALFEAILPSDQAYAGTYTAKAPDLLLVPADPALMLLHDIGGSLWDTAGQTGLHRLEGVWMLRAPGVYPGERRSPMPIEAVAGNLLNILNLSSAAIPSPDETKPATAASSAAGLPEGAWSTIRDPAVCWPVPLDSDKSNKQTVNSLVNRTEAEAMDKFQIIERLRTMGYM